MTMGKVSEPYWLVVFDDGRGDRTASLPIETEANDRAEAEREAFQRALASDIGGVLEAYVDASYHEDARFEVYTIGRADSKHPELFPMQRAARVLDEEFPDVDDLKTVIADG